MTMNLVQFKKLIEAEFAAQIEEVTIETGLLSVRTSKEAFLPLVEELNQRDEFSFKQLTEVTALDYPGRAKRFDLVCLLLSHRLNQRIMLKVSLEEDEVFPSLVDLYPSAGWHEREVWDMYGIPFENNPDLRRILTDYGFEGHPLRKDFPLTGYVEVRYDEDQKRVIYEPVNLKQEFRNFDFLSPWEGVLPVKGQENVDDNAQEKEQEA